MFSLSSPSFRSGGRSQGLDMAKESDPTKDKDFKKVVGHFLATKPKTHKEIAQKNKTRVSNSGGIVAENLVRGGQKSAPDFDK